MFLFPSYLSVERNEKKNQQQHMNIAYTKHIHRTQIQIARMSTSVLDQNLINDFKSKIVPKSNQMMWNGQIPNQSITINWEMRKTISLHGFEFIFI